MVDSVPVLSIKDTEAHPLGYVRSATRMANGDVAVADQYTPAVSIYGSDGSFLRSVGQSGEGPGEFKIPFWVGSCDQDSLFVWDYYRMVIVYDAQGEYVRDYRPGGTPQYFSCTRGGQFVILDAPAQYDPPSASGQRSLGPLKIEDVEGVTKVNLGDWPAGENRALGKWSYVAASADRAFIGTADSASVQMYAMDGSDLGTVHIGVAGRPPTQANVDAAVEAIASLSSHKELRDRSRDIYGKIPVVDELPPYFGLLTDPEGVLWAVTSAPGDLQTTLQGVVPGKSGTVTLQLPARLEVYEIGDDYILGCLTGEYDSQEVVQYRLDRSAVAAHLDSD